MPEKLFTIAFIGRIEVYGPYIPPEASVGRTSDF